MYFLEYNPKKTYNFWITIQKIDQVEVLGCAK